MLYPENFVFTLERQGFNRRTKKEVEPVNAFATELRQKASGSKFNELKDSLVRNRIVCGILGQRELTLQRAINLCRAGVLESQLREIGEEKNVHDVKDKKDKKHNYKQRVAHPDP